ncbi:hypothetical protein [Sphaerothrix gracilis]|uniref:hypothetical protein n=1 Tax=Sphaerothrix gracilis TaxID=3151835 RepID=UPI0031FD076D
MSKRKKCYRLEIEITGFAYQVAVSLGAIAAKKREEVGKKSGRFSAFETGLVFV